MQPNILLIFPDQWRWDWLGCETSPYGKVPVKTPHIDRLAASGIRFSGCRSNSPLCSPSRACLATGRRYHRCGVPDNSVCTPDNPATLFKLLREAGYHTATCGKSDLFKPDQTPTTGGYLAIMDSLGFSDGIDHRGKADAVNRARRGVNEPYTVMLREKGLLESHLADHPIHALKRPAGPSPLPIEAHTDSFCGNNALKLLDRAPEGKPWCLWVNFPGPHDPHDPPAGILPRYEGQDFPPAVNPTDHPPAHRDVMCDRLHYAASCSHIDDWVGRLVEAIHHRGEEDNTVIVFASDHGEMLGDHGRWEKSTWHEGSLRVPLILSGPGICQDAQSDMPVELIDLSATLLEVAGVRIPEGWDSRSLLPFLRGKKSCHHDITFSQLADWRCATNNRWKLVEEKDGLLRLFNLQEDPGELVNLAGRLPEVREKLLGLLEEENPWFSH